MKTYTIEIRETRTGEVKVEAENEEAAEELAAKKFKEGKVPTEHYGLEVKEEEYGDWIDF